MSNELHPTFAAIFDNLRRANLNGSDLREAMNQRDDKSNVLINCKIISRQGDGPLFTFTDGSVTFHLDGYLIIPIEDPRVSHIDVQIEAEARASDDERADDPMTAEGYRDIVREMRDDDDRAGIA